MINYKLAKYLSWQEMKDYIYVIDERNNNLFFINGIGKDIWVRLSNNYSTNSIVNDLKIAYSLSQQKDVNEYILDFIDDLIDRELIYERKL